MNGTLNFFPLSDDAASSSESPNGSRDMMDIRNIVDNSNSRATNQEETAPTIDLINQQLNDTEPAAHQLTNGSSSHHIQLSYGSYGARPLTNIANSSLVMNHSTNGSACDADGSSGNEGDNDSSNNTVVEQAQQEIALNGSQRSSLGSIRESSQEAEQIQLQETEPEPEPEQPEQPAEQQEEEQQGSSEDTEPELQPEPTPAPVEEDLSIRSRHLVNATHVDQTPFADKIDLIADYQDSAVIMSSDETYGAASNLIKTVAEPPHTNFQPNEEGMQYRWIEEIERVTNMTWL